MCGGWLIQKMKQRSGFALQSFDNAKTSGLYRAYAQ